jgi:hypothetical protein
VASPADSSRSPAGAADGITSNLLAGAREWGQQFVIVTMVEAGGRLEIPELEIRAQGARQATTVDRAGPGDRKLVTKVMVKVTSNVAGQGVKVKDSFALPPGFV